MKREKGKIITITSSKGGVGKTTLLLNLAGIYSKLNKRVLLLDFDFGSGVISLNLNLKTHKNIYHVADDIRNNRYLNYKDYISSYNDNIDVVGSVKDPRYANKIDVKDLELFLNDVSYHYDVVLIDTTHGLNKNNVLTLDITNVDEDIKVKLRGAIRYFNGEMNNIPVQIKNAEETVSCGAIYCTDDVLEIFKNILGHERVLIEEL